MPLKSQGARRKWGAGCRDSETDAPKERRGLLQDLGLFLPWLQPPSPTLGKFQIEGKKSGTHLHPDI